jgi:hypothetical protein
LVRLYNLQEGDETELEERRDGILVRVGEGSHGALPWDAAYQEMAAKSAETEE